MMTEKGSSPKKSDNKNQKTFEVVAEWLGCDLAQAIASQTMTIIETVPMSREAFSQSGQTCESPLSRPGWPLLRLAATMSPIRESQTREMPVVQWVMGLPNRSVSSVVENRTERETETLHFDSMDSANCLTAAPRQLPNELEVFIEKDPKGCRLFSYAEIRTATSQFSPENLIGEGGCSSVYRGCLGRDQSVAVKILKPYKEAWDDFFMEAKFVYSIKHKHITSLIGFCVEDANLILVYDLFPRGSLDENLHGCGDGPVLPWKVRFNVAVAVAEALNHLHNDCAQPIIHRDVKSSNILLSNDLQPQLSDFGLAIWGSTDSTCVISNDLVGTFGYIAPEYFMHGRVSDKIDVYAFGVVLLELLSGRKPVDAGAPKGQESLVKWGRHLFESGDLKALVDSKLNGDYDVVQMRSMVLAASQCINQSARLRPKVNQVLKLLRGETDANECVDSREWGYQEDDDDLYLEVDCKSRSASAMSDTNDDSISSSSTETASTAGKTPRYKLKDYLAIPQSHHHSLSEVFLLSQHSF